ncbi:lymphocyte-specific helicase-like isoform X2 [Thrips palmi]|nr:lymphocyte-specific helicase-like isoform X2 [Thrips palmi]XP_034242115.1 lymphocyte-specific helicase-like isoform X2 [Thrips palmi]XP_034242116.1 lymphocyte-specific helicase-like isoform X2 [Thrips palmi]
MEESSSHAASSSGSETSDGQNGKDVPQTDGVDNATESTANGSTEPLSNAETHSEMDAVLEEESERLDKVMSKSQEAHKKDYKPQDIDKNHQYKKLVELLTKSQFYTEFLVKKLEQDPLKRNSPKKGRGRKKDDKNDQPVPRKGNQRDTERVMEIAADVIANKKSGEEDVEEGPAAEDADSGRTKTLESGLVVPLGQPKLLVGACLRDYQMEGLNWLRLLFENGVNGILADEMGLGKTIQVIALICHLVEKNVRGPFLVIGPLSTLPNWAIEFERFAPQIPFILYYGNEESRIALRKKMSQKKVVEGHKVYPVIITSYDYPLRDAKFLNKTSWRYIIIDEGHRLKNHNSLLSRALRQYTSANRLLLTGTPLHNSLSELWALLNFLVPEIFDNLEIFESWFRIEDLSDDNASEKVLEEEKKSQILSTMHKILSPFMLRRVKSEVKLNLPSKKELVVYAPMSSIQLDLYRAVLDYNYSKLKAMDEQKDVEEDGSRPKRSCTQTKKYYVLEDLFHDEDALMNSSGSTIDNKTLIVEDKENPKYAIRVKMQNSSMMLRKIVNHPYLIQYPLEQGTEYARIDEDLVKASGKLQVLDAMLTKLKERGHKVLLFSTFTSLIEILEDYLSLRSFPYVRLDGNTKLEDRQAYIKQYNNDPDMFLFLISTRAGGLGINLAAADTVIIFDSDWNPQVDLQAQDRCHRIGQTRPVVVYRFVTAGTVDERIFVRAAAKRKLEKIIIHKGNYSALKPKDEHSIDLVELRKLLNSRDHQQVIYPNGYVFSDNELDELLDRSDLIDGKVENSSSSGSKVEERSFKEYYGYTGTKKVINDEEISSNVQIVDQDSNDAPCEVTPVKRSPMKKNGSSETVSVQNHDSELNDQSETNDAERSAQQNKGTTSEGPDESDSGSQPAKRIKLQDEAEVGSSESSKSSIPRTNRAAKKL